MLKEEWNNSQSYAGTMRKQKRTNDIEQQKDNSIVNAQH